ncbi:MAG TPA: ABC transporter permease [Thermomicrobiales bacterium]|nr:ABC transporter permease [Thermomicrobiales bacterium]
MNTLTIARFTLQEAISRRLILAGTILSMAFLGLFALGFFLIYQNDSELSGPLSDAQAQAMFGTVMSVLGLYAINFLAGFLALFLSVGAISSEIDSGALHAVLARPLRRVEFVAGRWLAYAGLISVYVGVMAGSLLLSAWLIADYTTPDPVRATLLMMLAAIVLLTISLLGSTILSTLANGVVVFSLFGLAWLAGIIEFIGGALSNESMLNIGTAVSLLIPSDAIWRGASYYVLSPLYLAGVQSAEEGMPFVGNVPPATPMVIWALLYPVVLLGAAILTFSRRDL